MKGRSGSIIRDVKLLHLKYLVFGTRDIENHLLIAEVIVTLTRCHS